MYRWQKKMTEEAVITAKHLTFKCGILACRKLFWMDKLQIKVHGLWQSLQLCHCWQQISPYSAKCALYKECCRLVTDLVTQRKILFTLLKYFWVLTSTSDDQEGLLLCWKSCYIDLSLCRQCEWCLNEVPHLECSYCILLFLKTGNFKCKYKM